MRAVLPLLHTPESADMTPTFSMPSVVLPLELHDYIIDFLHDETDELKRTALVCRYWLSSSRFHLFSSVMDYSELSFTENIPFWYFSSLDFQVEISS